MNPRTRRESLLLQDLPGETLVYDERAHRAHCLNGTAAAVFRLADGSRSVPALARALGDSVGSAEPELVWAALAELQRADLLDACPAPPRSDTTRSRREALKRLGLGTLLPAVVSVLAPTPAAALATCVSDCSGQEIFTPCGDCLTQACDGDGNCV